jgi:hypothetical protein
MCVRTSRCARHTQILAKKEEVEENNQYFRFPFVINPATKKQQLEMEAAAENG